MSSVRYSVSFEIHFSGPATDSVSLATFVLSSLLLGLAELDDLDWRRLKANILRIVRATMVVRQVGLSLV